jgi:hypothetical protein
MSLLQFYQYMKDVIFAAVGTKPLPDSQTTSKKRKSSALDEEQLLNLNKDIWVKNILPFVGIGHFAFVGSVNHKMNEHYQDFCDSLKVRPWVKCQRIQNGTHFRRASKVDTLPSAIFASERCAELYFDSQSSNKKFKYDTKFCSDIAMTGNLEMLKWARSKNMPWDATTCASATIAGNLKMLMWAHENGCPWDDATCAHAALGGHLQILEYAHEHGCLWDKMTCLFAATKNRLDILQYARRMGCPWDSSICAEAATYGHLVLLRWAHQHGCPCDERTCYEAARNGHLAVLKYALLSGCPFNEEECLKTAAHNEHFEVLKYIARRPCRCMDRN